MLAAMAGLLDIRFGPERTLLVRAEGELDREVARILLRVVVTAVAGRVARLKVDLSDARCTPDAEAVLTGCRRIATVMPERVSFGDVA